MTSNGSMEFKYIEDAQALAEAAREMAREPVIAFDLECDNNLHHYGSKICLMQFASTRGNYVVDVLAGMDLSPLRGMMEGSEVEIVMHDTDFDMRSLDRELGWRPKRLFDTLIAARLCGYKSFGMAAMIEHHFGVKLLKRYQRADWSARPLEKEMLDYAAGDVHYLLVLRERLIGELTEKGRMDWALEEFARCESIRYEPDDRPAFARVKGASKLPETLLPLVDELAKARDGIARRLNVPPYRVMSDEVLLRLAERPPSGEAELASGRGLHPYLRGKGGRRIVEAIKRAGGRRPLRWPRKRREGKRLNLSPGLLEELKAWRIAKAESSGLDPDLVIPMVALKRLAGRQPPAEVLSEEPVRRWQREAFGDELVSVLGRKT